MTGHEVLQIRQRLKLTRAALAGQLGVAPNSIYRWETHRMKIREPVARLLRLVAGVLAKNSVSQAP